MPGRRLRTFTLWTGTTLCILIAAAFVASAFWQIEFQFSHAVCFYLTGGSLTRARSSACFLRLPDAACPFIWVGQTRDLPVLARGVSADARGLWPRGTAAHLAISMRRVWPSAFSYSVGVPEESSFAAQYPACRYPCQRLAAALTGSHA